MAEHKGLAFVGAQRLTVSGRRLHPGEAAPDFTLEYLDLADLAIRMVDLADSTGMIRMLNVVNSLQRPRCQRVTRQWEALCAELPANVCIYTVSMDSPQLQAGFQESAGVLHQALSAQRSDQFGQDYGVWLTEWRLLQRSVFVIDQNARIIYTEYVADQHDEPTYAAALQAVAFAAAV
ncbi:MAG: redoxin domain-containing protein [Caldilineaceae bacterium]